jgi:hypothetical protein
MPNRRIPTREDWGDLKDLDVRHGYKRYGGKTIVEATPLFVENPTQRLSELQCAPSTVFNYYVFCYADFLCSDESKGESDCASCFLSLVLDRARNDAPSLTPIQQELIRAVDTVANRQTYYDASIDIYGSFVDRGKGIKACFVTHDA